MGYRFFIVFFWFAALVLPWPQAEAAGTGGAAPEYRENFKALALARTGFQKTIEFARSQPALYDPQQRPPGALLTRQEKMVLWSTWSSVLDHVVALDSLRKSHEDFLSLPDKERKDRSFSLYQGAFLAEYRFSLEFIELAEHNPDLDTVLNEEVPELGLGPGTYKGFKLRFLNVARASEFAALELIGKGLGSAEGDLAQAQDDDRAVISRMGKGPGLRLTAENAADIVKKAGFIAWFPVQKGASSWMGDVRVRRGGTALISAAQIRGMKARLEPGDILLERREWFLSNLGLPGFWTHAALYIGTPEERTRALSGPEVAQWVRSQGVESGEFEALLRTRFPEAYERSCAVQHGTPPRVLEAISEGVSFTTLEHTAQADSFAVLRPRLGKEAKARAVLQAFHYSGRPYDFNFDFRTDASLVCSELIYKAYEPSEGQAGLRFVMEELMDRTLTTPNTMAFQFDEEYDRPERQIDLVLFLDGYEKGNQAVEANAETFRLSWKRPKWHVLVQEEPEAGSK